MNRPETPPLAPKKLQPALIDMVSAGTLMVFAVVALALIWHRYVDPKTPHSERVKPALGMAVLTAAGIGAGERGLLARSFDHV